MSDSPAFRPIRRHIIVGVVGLTALLGACGGDDDVDAEDDKDTVDDDDTGNMQVGS